MRESRAEKMFAERLEDDPSVVSWLAQPGSTLALVIVDTVPDVLPGRVDRSGRWG
jgi:hypothetical protein